MFVGVMPVTDEVSKDQPPRVRVSEVKTRASRGLMIPCRSMIVGSDCGFELRPTGLKQLC
jgi:hypothetical protein